MTAELILSRLQRVKSTGKDAWLALCPAHDDTRPSLAIRETPDGRVLIKCWSGCGSNAVIASLGLDWIDLAPPHIKDDYERYKGRCWQSTPPWRELVQYLREDLEVVQLGAERIALDEDYLEIDDLRRIWIAAARIKKIIERAGA